MFGFETKSDSGQLLASSQYLNLHLLPSVTDLGTFRYPNVSWGLMWRRVSVAYNSASPPIIFIDLEVGESAAAHNLQRVGSTWEFWITAGLTSPTVPAASKVKAFGRLLTPTSGGNGVKVFNSDGVITFSSQDTPLWLTDYYSYSSSTLTSPNYANITGTLTYTNSNPIFTCYPLKLALFPFDLSILLIGWKRTGASTFTSQSLGDSVGSVFIRTTNILIADFVP